MELVLKIFQTILSVVAILILYRYVYMAIGFFGKAKKFKEAETEHKFAVVICAKNEEKIIRRINCTFLSLRITAMTIPRPLRRKKARPYMKGTMRSMPAKDGRLNSGFIKYEKNSVSTALKGIVFSMRTIFCIPITCAK